MAAHPRSDEAFIASNNYQERSRAVIDSGEQCLGFLSIIENQGPYTTAKSIPTYDDFNQKGDDSNRDLRDGTTPRRFHTTESKTSVQDLNSDAIGDFAGDGEALGSDILERPCSQGDLGEKAFHVSNDFIGTLENLFSPAYTAREDIASINGELDILADPLSTYASLKHHRNDTMLKEANNVSESEVQAQGDSEKIGGNCVYGLALKSGPSLMKNPLQLASPSEYANTGLVREFVRDDQSACSSADSHDPEVFDDDKLDYSGNGAGDGRSTPQTLISEGMPIPDGEGSMNEGKITKSSHVPDESLFRSMSRNGFLPGRAISHQRGTDMETKSNVIDLRKTDAQPRQHITDALYNFEKVEPSLKYTTSTPHSSLELGSVCSINVGFDEFVYRWKPGSMITFNVEPQSFPDTSYAAHATRSLEEAARKWNEGEVGVRFEKVADHEPAAFRLVYWKQNSQEPKTLAKAFLPIPSEVQRNQPQLFVYSIAFDKEKGNYNDLAKIFCHELGHVLGLRHEFAKEKESHMPCVQFGESNSSSVMNYFNHARKYRIQKSDYNDVRLFYAYKGTVYNGFRVIDVDPMYFTSPMQF